jgi:hypothetical protein
MTKQERLAELIFEVAEGWAKQQSYAFGRSKLMYDCSLFDCQSEDTAFEPEICGDMVSWECEVSTNAGLDWHDTKISIPKWLYNWYMNGKASFISWRKVI